MNAKSLLESIVRVFSFVIGCLFVSSSVSYLPMKKGARVNSVEIWSFLLFIFLGLGLILFSLLLRWKTASPRTRWIASILALLLVGPTAIGVVVQMLFWAIS